MPDQDSIPWLKVIVCNEFRNRVLLHASYNMHTLACMHRYTHHTHHTQSTHTHTHTHTLTHSHTHTHTHTHLCLCSGLTKSVHPEHRMKLGNEFSLNYQVSGTLSGQPASATYCHHGNRSHLFHQVSSRGG